MSSIGDCELCVGAAPKFKVHVHSDSPDKVLKYFLKQGQISEVFIHNMQLQSEERVEKLAETPEQQANKEHKSMAVVAVAVGSGNVEILKSLGVDIVVSGGQTMNPSTKDLADAAKAANADNVIFLPNNKNIILAAKSACDVLDCNAAVVETKNVLSAFSAMMCFDPNETLGNNVAMMTDSFEDIKVAEITFAIKDSKDAHNNPINNGDCIGIVDGKIEIVDKTVEAVVEKLLRYMQAQDMGMLTILAGSDMQQANFDNLVKNIENCYNNLEIDAQCGGQPLYPIIFALE